MKRKIKNTILKSTATIMSALAFIAAFSADTESWIPTIVCLVCMGWLALYSYANDWWMDAEW